LKQRRFDIDWIRVVSMLIIFFFHNARFFDTGDWHLKNPDKSLGFMVFVGFIAQWIMPLFFFISGVGSWFALEHKNSKQYLLERIKRLLVPFYFIGFLVLIPPQYYWEQVTHGHFIGDFFQFIPNYFHFPAEPQLFGFYFGFHPTFLSYWPGHLWFLRYLFILSLITLPIMKYFKSNSGRMLITKLAGFSYRRGGIFLFAVPIALVQIVLRAASPNYLSWADFAFWLVIFLIGYIVPSDDRFTQAIKRNSWISLIVGIFMFMLMGYLLNKSGYRDALMIHPSYSAGYIVFQTISSLNTWCWIVFIFSIGVTFLNFNNNILSYCNEAVLPFYILHQTIILIVGFFVIQWNLNIMLKYIIISTSSFALIIIIYEFFIRRFNIIRFLFGMKRFEKNLGQ
jgi:glucans biosynthesis protein C